MFFIGHERRDLLLQMAVVSFRTQYNMDDPDKPDQGDQDVEKAIAWQRGKFPRESATLDYLQEAHAAFMLEAVDGEDLPTPQDDELHDVCCV